MRYFLLLAIGCSILLAGCRTPQTVKDAWKGSRAYYNEYVNKPALLNMEDKGDVEDYQAALGAAISDFDLQIQELERVMHNSDRSPDANWVSAITTRFPWLSGVALTDELGVARSQVPTDFPKGFEIGNLAEEDKKQQLKDLRAYVQNHPLGPEIYIGNPVYIGNNFRGVITIHFDPRGLLARTGDAAKVVLAGPDGIIWPGLYDVAATPLANVNWAEEARKNHSGIFRNDLGAFYWVSRYIGNLPLIYAIRIQGEFPLRAENMSGLVEANAFAIGPIKFSDMPQPSAQPEMPTEPMETPREITPDGSNSPLIGPGKVPTNSQDTTPLVH